MPSPRKVLFLGEERTVPFIGGRRLVRIGAALKELATSVTVRQGDEEKTLAEALVGLPISEYPSVIAVAVQTILDDCSDKGAELTQPERLVYGTLGELIGLSAEDVADAPLDDLVALATAVYEQEQNTQAGKRLIRTFLRYGEESSPSTPGESESGSNVATTTPAESSQTLAASGAA